MHTGDTRGWAHGAGDVGGTGGTSALSHVLDGASNSIGACA